MSTEDKLYVPYTETGKWIFGASALAMLASGVVAITQAAIVTVEAASERLQVSPDRPEVLVGAVGIAAVSYLTATKAPEHIDAFFEPVNRSEDN